MCLTSSSQAGLWFRPKLEENLASQIGLCWTQLDNLPKLFITTFSNWGEISHFSKHVFLTPFWKNVIGMWVGCLEPASYLETRCKSLSSAKWLRLRACFVLFNKHARVSLKHSATPSRNNAAHIISWNNGVGRQLSTHKTGWNNSSWYSSQIL